MSTHRLLRLAALYHGLLGLVLTLAPGGVFSFLGIELPPYRLFYGLSAVAPLIAGLACEVARRDEALRGGLTYGLMVGNLAAAVVIVGWVIWDDMPLVLLMTGVAAGLWAWLFWGVYSPEQPENDDRN